MSIHSFGDDSLYVTFPVCLTVVYGGKFSVWFGLIRIFYMGYLRIVRLFYRDVNLTSKGPLHDGKKKKKGSLVK